MTPTSPTPSDAGAFDPTKPVETKAGHAVSCLESGGFTGIIHLPTGDTFCTWRSDGTAKPHFHKDNLDLVNVAPPQSGEGETDAAFVEFLAQSARFADWAGGEGVFFEDENGKCDPQEFVSDYLNNVEPKGSVADHVRERLTKMLARRALTPPDQTAVLAEREQPTSISSWFRAWEDAIRAQPEPQPVASDDGWRTMESAPKDETKIDLWVLPHDAFANGNPARIADACWRANCWARLIGDCWFAVDDCGTPTYWRLPPAPPAAIRASGQQDGGAA